MDSSDSSLDVKLPDSQTTNEDMIVDDAEMKTEV